MSTVSFRARVHGVVWAVAMTIARIGPAHADAGAAAGPASVAAGPSAQSSADGAKAGGLDLSMLPGPTSLDLGSALVKLGLALALVLGIILLLQRAARRWGRNLGGTAGAEEIRILSQKPVGARLSLALVEVLGQRFLVGISPQGIRPVAELGDVGLYAEQTAAAASPVQDAPLPVQTMEGTASAPAGFADELRARLRTLQGNRP